MVEVNDKTIEAYNESNQIKIKTSMIRSSSCDYSDAYINVKGNIEVPNTAAQGAAPNNTKKKVTFKNCAPFINCLSQINNTQVDQALDIDVVLFMYNFLEYSDIYLKTSISLLQYHRDERALDNNDVIIDFPVYNNNIN